MTTLSFNFLLSVLNYVSIKQTLKHSFQFNVFCSSELQLCFTETDFYTTLIFKLDSFDSLGGVVFVIFPILFVLTENFKDNE